MTTSTIVEMTTLSTEAAETLTAQIREAGANAVKARTLLASLVTKARKGQAHVALGFKSWPDYVADVFGEAAMPGLKVGDRDYLVGFMAGEGMSSRAVARALNISQSTAARMIRQAVETGQVETDEIEGTDGKTRSRAKATKSKTKMETKPAPAAAKSIETAGTDELGTTAKAVVAELMRRWSEGDEAAEMLLAEVSGLIAGE